MYVSTTYRAYLPTYPSSAAAADRVCVKGNTRRHNQPENRTALKRRTPPLLQVSWWSHTGRSYTRTSRQANAMARRLSYRNRGLITRRKRTLPLKITIETPFDSRSPPRRQKRTSLSTVQNPCTRLKMYFYIQLK